MFLLLNLHHFIRMDHDANQIKELFHFIQVALQLCFHFYLIKKDRDAIIEEDKFLYLLATLQMFILEN